VAVAAGILLNVSFRSQAGFALTETQLVSIPIANGASTMADFLVFPAFSALKMAAVYKTAVVIAVVASLETLLCVEAADKLDRQKRITPTNRELKAQGIGNVVSGLLGGLPVTQVIVRSSANAQAGARTKTSAVIHGGLLAVSIIALPAVMNMIPLATLAAILLVVGYKLAKPAIFMKKFNHFIFTVLGIMFADLLIGIGLGIHVAVVVILFENYRLPFQIHNFKQEEGERVRIVLAQQVTFLNKASVLKTLDAIPAKSSVEIDATESIFIHPDIVEIINDYVIGAEAKEINVTITGLVSHQKAAGQEGMQVAVKYPSHPEPEGAR
jgi:MFS superfamily sulfate permease-like transporter